MHGPGHEPRPVEMRPPLALLLLTPVRGRELYDDQAEEGGVGPWYTDYAHFPGYGQSYDTAVDQGQGGEQEEARYSYPSYEDYGVHSEDTEHIEVAEDKPDEEETVTNTTVIKAKKTFKDVVWQWDDASWIMCAIFMTFTMQTGFAILESGCSSLKNEVSVMMKNVIDVLAGGISYWAFGHGLCVGADTFSNPFFGVGDFFVTAEGLQTGPVYGTFIFLLSYATTSTTIVSGAIAERTNLYAYILFSFFNTFVYSLPARWLWTEVGFLKALDVVDVAGSSGVHLVGGAGALAASVLLGPRLGRWEISGDPPMGSATNAILGCMFLWWGWIAFNQGASFGVSGTKWILAIKMTVTSCLASFSGGTVSIIYSLVTRKGKTDVMLVCNGILAALVGIMASCANVTNLESVVIGGLAALLVIGASHILVILRWPKGRAKLGWSQNIQSCHVLNMQV